MRAAPKVLEFGLERRNPGTEHRRLATNAGTATTKAAAVRHAPRPRVRSQLRAPHRCGAYFKETEAREGHPLRVLPLHRDGRLERPAYRTAARRVPQHVKEEASHEERDGRQR